MNGRNTVRVCHGKPSYLYYKKQRLSLLLNFIPKVVVSLGF